MAHPSQQLLKRQREWVYLTHFLALMHLHPIKTISGQDDGQEPDFTCLFRHQTRPTPYVVGIELTTLPRLRDRLGNDNLMLKRWYWQSILQVSTGFNPSTINDAGEQVLAGQSSSLHAHPNIQTVGIADTMYDSPTHLIRRKTLANRLQQGVAKTMRWLPSAFFTDMTDAVTLPIDSLVTQADLNAVMAKKAKKVASYQHKRRLDETWLLIHTNEQQENGVLRFLHDQRFVHDSDFDQVLMTFYPSDMILQIEKLKAV